MTYVKSVIGVFQMVEARKGKDEIMILTEIMNPEGSPKRRFAFIKSAMIDVDEVLKNG